MGLCWIVDSRDAGYGDQISDYSAQLKLAVLAENQDVIFLLHRKLPASSLAASIRQKDYAGGQQTTVAAIEMTRPAVL